VQISTRRSATATVIDVVGDIDLSNSSDIRKLVLETVKRAPRVIINLEKVKYIDSSGLATLVEGLKESQTLKNRFILVGLSTPARELLELTRLIKVFEVYENEEQALRA